MMPDTPTRLRAVLIQHFALDDRDPKLADLGSVNLVSDFGADSLDMVEMLLHVEDAFGISISDAEAEAALGHDGDMPLAGFIALVGRKRGVTA